MTDKVIFETYFLLTALTGPHRRLPCQLFSIFSHLSLLCGPVTENQQNRNNKKDLPCADSGSVAELKSHYDKCECRMN